MAVRLSERLTPPQARAKKEQSEQPYVMPRCILFGVIWAFLRRKRRSVWDDTLRAQDTLRHKPIVRGMQHVPQDGPVVFLPNHYERKDKVWVGWGAIGLTSALARERDTLRLRDLHWVMTDTWADCYFGPIHLNPIYLGWILKGFGDVYGIIRMPAHDLPNHKDQRGRSASALRDLLGHLDQGECIAFHPEAGGFEELIVPPAGAGRLLAAINRRGVTMIPVGVFEEDDRLVINIGTPFASGDFQDKSDEDAAAVAMHAIADLVPAHTRGAFAHRA